MDKSIDTELPITKTLINYFPLQNLMGEYLASQKAVPKASLADSLLQPVEYSYTVESLNELVNKCHLEILNPCVCQFDKQAGSFLWNINNKEIEDYYYSLPDVQRWQVSNLLMFKQSPMLWFYLQRQDSENQRKSEREICDDFLETTFEKCKTYSKNYTLTLEGRYMLNPREVPCPAPPTPVDLISKKVFAAVNSKTPMHKIFHDLNIDTSFNTVNKIRVNLTSSAFSYLKTVK